MAEWFLDRKIKLIGLDLDGTVLNNNKEMTDEVASAIEEAIIKGVTVVPVTGRPLSGLPESIRKIKGMKYAITSNGAVLADLENNMVCRAFFLPAESVMFMLELAEQYDCIYSIFINGRGYSDIKAHNKLVEMFEGTPLSAYVAESRTGIKGIRGFLEAATDEKFSEEESEKYGLSENKSLKNADCVENFWICCKKTDDCDAIELALRQNFPRLNIHRMMKTDVEMVAPDADKGDTFLELAAMLGVNPKETAGIGDSVNDIGFMKKSGISIAMGNARESIKAIADYVTEDNEHNGAAIAIRRII